MLQNATLFLSRWKTSADADHFLAPPTSHPSASLVTRPVSFPLDPCPRRCLSVSLLPASPWSLATLSVLCDLPLRQGPTVGPFRAVPRLSLRWLLVFTRFASMPLTLSLLSLSLSSLTCPCARVRAFRLPYSRRLLPAGKTRSTPPLRAARPSLLICCRRVPGSNHWSSLRNAPPQSTPLNLSLSNFLHSDKISHLGVDRLPII